MLQALMDKIRGKQAERQQQRAATYSELVKLLADGGKEPKPDDVLAILDAANKTADDLAADVQLRQQRAVWREQMQAAETARETLRQAQAAIESSLAATNKVIADAKQSHQVTYQRENERIRAAQQVLNDAQTARIKLVETATENPRKAMAMQAGHEAAQELFNNENRDMYREQQHLQLRVDALRAEIDSERSNRTEQDMQRELAGLVARLDQVTAAIQQHEGTLQVAQTEIQAIEAEAIAE